MSCLFINEHGGRFTVEPAHSNIPLYRGSTQVEAIDWAKRNWPTYAFHVARVRHPSDKHNPDHWRHIH
jgi:hypothetical protein